MVARDIEGGKTSRQRILINVKCASHISPLWPLANFKIKVFALAKYAEGGISPFLSLANTVYSLGLYCSKETQYHILEWPKNSWSIAALHTPFIFPIPLFANTYTMISHTEQSTCQRNTNYSSVMAEIGSKCRAGDGGMCMFLSNFQTTRQK